MNRKDLDALNELYLSVYEEEQLNEVSTPITTSEPKTGSLNSKGEIYVDKKYGYQSWGSARKLLGPEDERVGDQPPARTRLTGTRSTGATAPARPTAPTPAETRSQVVPPGTRPPAALVLPPPSGTRTQVPPAALVLPPPSGTAAAPERPTAPTPATERSPQGYSVGTTAGGTKFERRAATGAELRAAQAARAAAKAAGQSKSDSEEAAVKAGVEASKPTTPASTIRPGGFGASSADMNAKSSVSSVTAPAKPAPASTVRPGGFGASSADMNAKSSVSSVTAPAKPTTQTSTVRPGGFGASTANMNATSSTSSVTAPSTPINNKKPPTPGMGATMQKQSYEWNSSKTLRDITNAYNEIYEAKKKVDQDEDDDNDFADIRIARMIASGVPKAKAIAMVKDKDYNKKDGLDEATAMAKRGYDETEIRNMIAGNTKGGEAADRATELENRPTYGNIKKKAERERLGRMQRGTFRRTNSSDYGLRGYGYQSNDPEVKALQRARGKQRSALTPNEKKMLNREAYAAYEFVASYLLENNFANTVDDANVIINNMSEGWFNQIMEDVRGNQYTPNPIGNAIKAGAGLAKKVFSNPTVSSTINKTLRGNNSSGGYSTKSGDGKPYKDGPLWNGPSTTSTKPQTKNQPPNRDEPLW